MAESKEEMMEAMTARQRKEQRVYDLEAHLNATDYKVLKDLAAQALGEELPYDLKEVEAERQKCRDEINAIQAELANDE